MIKAAALEQFQTHGYDRTTTKQIAQLSQRTMPSSSLREEVQNRLAALP